MRKGLRTTVSAVAASTVVTGAAPASASVGWTVASSGSANGDSGVITLHGAQGVATDCQSSGAEITFNDRVLAGIRTFEWNAGKLSPQASNYRAPVVSGETRDVSVEIVSAGFLVTLAGFVRVMHDNDTARCLGLFNTGDTLALSGVYDISPGQDIVPAAEER